MIVPLKAEISAIERLEGWQGAELEFMGQWNTPRYRVELTAYDTEKREIREWSFWSMEGKVPGAGGYDGIGQIRARAVSFDDMRAMVNLRGEIDGVLKSGEPRSRWEAFSDEEIADLASLVAAADESYDLSADSERLSAEVKAERDHRETRLS